MKDERSGLCAVRNSGDPGAELGDVVDELCRACDGGDLAVLRGPGRFGLPSRRVVVEIVEELRSVLFPGYFGLTDLSRASLSFHVGATLDRVLRVLQEQIRRGFCFDCEKEEPDVDCSACDRQALVTTRGFLGRLPRVQRLLASDVQAAYEGDPAAKNPDEAVFCYPGIQALTCFRLAHELHTLGVPIIPRIITEYAHSATGIDIHPGARIGASFFIDHGTGVVIGETSEIGERVRLYQGVTLGAKSFPLDDDGLPIKGMARHPRVEDDVIIYAGSTILGRVTIGCGAVIGGNVWLARDVPAGAVVTQAREREDRFENGAGI